ncbi:MAG: immunoglobulin-like domain-containing protein, partial [Hominilimicola sp.]
MKKNRIICLLLWLVIILSFGTVSAQADEVGYKFAGSEEGDGFVLRISLQNVKALSGRLAIAFDTEKLEIADISSLSEAVEKSSEVNISPEGLDNSVLMSNKDGYIMFAWYAARNAGIDALSGAVEIASIKFNLKDGVTTDDFSRNTISLYYVNETMVDKWDCSAGIVDNNLDMYRNNAFSDDYRCGITYDYPNCDYVPIVTYDAVIRVTDATGNPLKATVWADNIQSQTDSNGYALFPMENGVYTYRVSALGYESKSGYIIIKDTAAQVGVQLRSYEQLLENIADNLSIGFTDGDGANSVTAGISLPQSGEYGEVITWKSSNSAVISDEGFVIRTDEDCSVRLTATLSLGTATTKRTFDVTVKSKQTTEEKNTAAVEKDLQSLVITYAPGDSENSVTADLSLPEMGANGSTVVWSSSDEDIVNKYGMVARPEQDTEIVLTALVMRGSAQRTKTFKITVKGESKQSASTDDEIINSVLSALAIGYSDGDSAESVTKQLNLPVSGADGTVIEWSSSQPAVVTAYGGVVRQAQDVSITLTATAAKGNVSKSKTFV